MDFFNPTHHRDWQGYTFYLVIFYVLVAVLFSSVAICTWVGWCFMVGQEEQGAG